MIERIVIEHAKTCPFYSHPKNSEAICLSHDNTERPCDRRCEFCMKFSKSLEGIL